MASYSRTELLEMVLAEGSAQRQLHADAAAVRDKVYGRTVVVRGVIEVTNVCRVNCDYCPMRRDNTRQNTSYTLQPEEIWLLPGTFTNRASTHSSFKAERSRRQPK